MCTRAECQRYVGQWVGFRTRYGYHIGKVERITKDSAIVLSPRQYIPAQLASTEITDDESHRLDVALAWWGGFGRRGYPAVGYGPGAVGGYGPHGGAGYGGWAGYGWGRWAVSFLIIYLLWGLWFW
ncbi:hypothetical protein [Alicyclobacillus acidiphilus]|uniref:hypothetical protein n=1 Tax=Alicyclobacillus acidiphilus TaxID=182455 RepID=UPI0009FB0281|nr:hypothetical protein [Alicyclobacillus acidiphilus]